MESFPSFIGEGMRTAIGKTIRTVGVAAFCASIFFAASPAFAQCAVRTPIGANDSVAGMLENGDCMVLELPMLLGQTDTSFMDIYQVVLSSPAILTIRQ